VGGIRTQNGTHLVFVGDASRWVDGRLRTLAGAGGGAINLDVYGLGERAADLVTPIRYTLDVKAIGGQVDWQLAPRSPWSVGARLVYAEVVPKLRDDPLFPGLEDRTQVRIAGPGIALIYDTRDTVFTPTRGYYADAGLIVSDEAFGANREFRRFDALAIGYWPVHDKVTVAMRADYQQVSEGTPFFARPYIMLRGIPAMRYPGHRVASTELEARWPFFGRWSVLAFGGVGHARLDDGLLTRDKTAGAGGVGFRYELARKFGLHAGIDVARGPEETAVYLQVGSAWFRP
jgi:Omp85 superfamily domain